MKIPFLQCQQEPFLTERSIVISFPKFRCGQRTRNQTFDFIGIGLELLVLYYSSCLLYIWIIQTLKVFFYRYKQTSTSNSTPWAVYVPILCPHYIFIGLFNLLWLSILKKCLCVKTHTQKTINQVKTHTLSTILNIFCFKSR